MTQKSKSGRFILPTPEEDAAITAAAMSDPDNPIITEAEWARMKPAPKRPVGRPPVEAPKTRITLRLSQHIVDQFRATGRGWHTRLNAALDEWLKDHPTP